MPEPDFLGELPAPDPDVLPEIRLFLELPEDNIEAGGRVEASLVIENTSDEPVHIQSEQPLFASIVLPGTRSVVGRYQGPVRGTGLGIVLGSHQEKRVPVTVLAGARTKVTEGNVVHYEHEDLVPGHYGVVASLPVLTAAKSGQPWMRQMLLTPEVAIEVVERKRSEE
jgi:hypothetical protein